MLRELHIENVAVIERADLELGPGLNILTGETGAGKSILVDAMHAILGSRASRELVRTGAEKAVVCATFDPEPCRAWCDENEIECDDELIIRRQITAEGKTSCRVCGVPVTTAQLRDLGALLLDIHGQNDGRHLLDEREHLRSLDKFGRLEPELARYQAQYQAYQALCKERDTLSAYENEKELLTDSLSRQLEELEHAQLKAGEEAELAERSDLLRNFEKLSEAVDLAYDLLAGRDDSASALAGEALSEVERAANYAGGPLVEPENENIIMTPICAHSLAGKSFVLAPGRQITIVPDRIHDRPAILVADGGDGIALIRGDHIRIRRSENYTLLADTGIRSFYETAFAKLTDRL